MLAFSKQGTLLIAFAAGLLIGAAVLDFLRAGIPIPGVGVIGILQPVAGTQKAAAAARSPLLPKATLRKVAVDLRDGGYILYFRHPQRQKWDSVIAFDVYELATGGDAATATFRDAVCLTAQGREEAKMIGRIFDLAKVPVGAVVSSPSCRARQAAELAFGRIDRLSVGLAHTPVTNADNAAEFAAELKRVLANIPIERGKNAVIMAHGNTLENNTDLFSSGGELLTPLLTETGFFVIKRDADRKLHVVQRFPNIADFAANAIDLKVTSKN